MLVERATSNQFALHLAKLLTYLLSPGNILPTLFKLVLVELPIPKIRCQDLRSPLFGLCTSTDPALQPATAILPVGRTLTRGAPTPHR